MGLDEYNCECNSQHKTMGQIDHQKQITVENETIIGKF